MRNVVFISVLFLLAGCVNRTSQGYNDDSLKELRSFMYEYGFSDDQIGKMKLLRIKEDSASYRYEWFQIADTGDTAFVDIKLNKQWPYTTGFTSFDHVDLLKTKRKSLRNLFDTTVVSVSNAGNYIDLVDGDTVNFIWGKGKIVDHIRKGHYEFLKRTSDTLIIKFYIPIALTDKRKYKIETALVRFENGYKIELEPISLPDSFYDVPRQAEVGRVYEYEVK